MKDNPEKAKEIINSLKNPTQSEPSPNPPTTPAPKPPSTAAPKPPTTPPSNLPSAFADQGWFNFRIFDYMIKAPIIEKLIHTEWWQLLPNCLELCLCGM